MQISSALNAEENHRIGLGVRVFNPISKAIWGLLVAVTVISETIPIPLMPRLPFYTYCAAKLLCFLAVGFLAPFAFLRFNALNRGILLAAVSATCVESLQGVLHRGHSFHWYELLLKLALILLGFAFALDARYEQKISVGPIHIRLIGEQVESRFPV